MKLNHFFVFPSRPQHLSYASGDLMVDASFMQTLWNMNPISSGCELAEGTHLLSTLGHAALNMFFYTYTCTSTDDNGHYQERASVFFTYAKIYSQFIHSLRHLFVFSGYLTGGHVLRLFHGHMDECLAIATPEEGEEKRR